jgi:ribosomal 30S subunit maturation factor RimM
VRNAIKALINLGSFINNPDPKKPKQEDYYVNDIVK